MPCGGLSLCQGGRIAYQIAQSENLIERMICGFKDQDSRKSDKPQLTLFDTAKLVHVYDVQQCSGLRGQRPQVGLVKG